MFEFLSSLLGLSPPLAQIDTAQAHARLRLTPPTYLLDVRQPEEYLEGHVAGAHLIPLPQLESRLAELPPDEPFMVICHAGRRSSLACRKLLQAGFQPLNIYGGMNAWLQAGLPVVKGAPLPEPAPEHP